MRLAKESGAQQSQVERLERAVSQGYVEFRDVRAAVDETFACLDGAGIGHVEQARDPGRQYVPIEFSVVLADPALDPVADACVEGYSFWIQSAFEQQPAGLEEADAEFERARPVIIACLTDHGITADESMTNAELKELLIYSEIGLDRSSGESPPEKWESMGCLDAAGINGF
mgnify:CR=1 FL=1